jgi:hypothetical protein
MPARILACESVQINAVYYIHHPTSRKKFAHSETDRQIDQPSSVRASGFAKNLPRIFLHREPRLQKVQIAQLAWGERAHPPPPCTHTCGLYNFLSPLLRLGFDETNR